MPKLVATQHNPAAVPAPAPRASERCGPRNMAKTAEAIDERFGASDESRLLRGHVLHNLHRFKAAEILARSLAARRGLPVDFALLSDALMEQGRLAEAAEAFAAIRKAKDNFKG